MAIVLNPALSMDASGNLGGICFSKHRGVAVARDVWTGTYPGTAKQIAQNALMTSVSQFWGAVGSTVEREKWERYAETVRLINRLGQEYVPTGYGIYMKLNLQRKKWGLGILNEPLPRIEPQDPGEIRAVWVDGESKFKFNLGSTVNIGHTGYGTDYYQAGPYDSPGRKPIAGEWRFTSYKIPPASTRSSVVVHDKWFWLRARQIWESGWTGNWFIRQALST